MARRSVGVELVDSAADHAPHAVCVGGRSPTMSTGSTNGSRFAAPVGRFVVRERRQ
jgi:hypothetical protein